MWPSTRAGNCAYFTDGKLSRAFRDLRGFSRASLVYRQRPGLTTCPKCCRPNAISAMMFRALRGLRLPVHRRARHTHTLSKGLSTLELLGLTCHVCLEEKGSCKALCKAHNCPRPPWLAGTFAMPWLPSWLLFLAPPASQPTWAVFLFSRVRGRLCLCWNFLPHNPSRLAQAYALCFVTTQICFNDALPPIQSKETRTYSLACPRRPSRGGGIRSPLGVPKKYEEEI